MNIFYYKKQALLVTVGILMSSAIPISPAMAQSTQIDISYIDQQDMYSLRPAEFRQAIGLTDSSMLVLKTYKNNQKYM